MRAQEGGGERPHRNAPARARRGSRGSRFRHAFDAAIRRFVCASAGPPRARESISNARNGSEYKKRRAGEKSENPRRPRPIGARRAKGARVWGFEKSRIPLIHWDIHTKPFFTNRITRVLGPGGRRARPRAGKKSVGNARSARRETRGIRGTRAGSTRRPPHSSALEAGFEPGGCRRSGARKTRSATSSPGSVGSSRRRRAKRVRGFGDARRVPPGRGRLRHSARAWRVCCVCAHRRPRG